MISVIPYSRTSRTPKHSAAIKYFFLNKLLQMGYASLFAVIHY